ncbi:MAG: 2-succinyl-5-enolpyruvyl-6-hydroxy-3-cyclohexene-1-carboxylate synthase, partial [Flavobacteriales bacterium]
VIVINNGGGGIFNVIDGASEHPQKEKYFETKHNYKVENIASAFGIPYYFSDDYKELTSILEEFYQYNGKPALLEVDTNFVDNGKVLKDYFRELSL